MLASFAGSLANRALAETWQRQTRPPTAISP
jgi:hypothetical protein